MAGAVELLVWQQEGSGRGRACTGSGGQVLKRGAEGFQTMWLPRVVSVLACRGRSAESPLGSQALEHKNEADPSHDLSTRRGCFVGDTACANETAVTRGCVWQAA